MLLAIDTSTAACSAALFDEAGLLLARRDEEIGRGHSERLVPMLEELLAGRRADHVLVGVGPGSFTGIRVGIAAAHGLAIGWGARLEGMSSLALLAAAAGTSGSVAAVVDGGHGEVFVQQFDGATLAAQGDLLNLPPGEAADRISASILVGPGASKLSQAGGAGTVLAAWPSASLALRLPPQQRSLDPRPLYARPPDAKARVVA